MKLNPDCIRDVLLYLEEHLQVDLKTHNFNNVTLKDLNNNTALKAKYSPEEIWYTVYNLKEARYIDGTISNSGSYKMVVCEIKNITWNGHQFLNTVRPQSVWDATLKGASKLGIMSIGALSTLAMEIAKAVVTDPATIAKIVALL